MKLKYYLRGIGIGVLVTTIIFMISISLHKNDTEPQKTDEPKDASMTIGEFENSTEDAKPVTKQSPEAVRNEAGDATETKDMPKPAETKPEQNPKETEQKEGTEPKTDEKISFEIGSGEYSDAVSRRLAEAGIVDDSQAFNRFLIDNGYDASIRSGTYEIPKDSTYEEIARLLTNK